jgi:phospholipase D1/2
MDLFGADRIKHLGLAEVSRIQRDYTFQETMLSLSIHGNFRRKPGTPKCDLKIIVTDDNDTGNPTQYTFQGERVMQTNQLSYFKPTGNLAPPTLLPANTLRIILNFQKTDWQRYIDVPINRTNWSGSVKATLQDEDTDSTINSQPVLIVRRGWGLPSVPDQHPYARATYKAQAGNYVKFYDDASQDARGSAGAFHDIGEAIEAAKYFIFMADWSFHPDVYLERPDGGPNPQKKVGQILVDKAKANPNMVIAIHTWYHVEGAIRDDMVNNSGGSRLNELSGGVQQRPPNLLWRMTERSGVLFWSHHQKFVVLDAPIKATEPDGKRELKVFFGGLDLTTGRFDWKEHLISGNEANARFWQFQDWYSLEFNKQIEQEVQAGNNSCTVPRQPWHDIHAQLRGPVAWDFVTEFVGRWNSSGTYFSSHGHLFASEANIKDVEARVWKKFVSISSPLGEGADIYQPYEQPEQDQKMDQQITDRPWTAQLYRSMEEGFWSPPPSSTTSTVPLNQKGTSDQLVQKFSWKIKHKKSKESEFEKSSHKAYLQAIKRAENFMYIETQYLIGRSALVEKSPNRIPETIVERILEINKLNPQKDFHVYIVTPLFPEGEPHGIPVLHVRYWQWETMKWMKNQLNNLQGGKTWENYLSFYFLGQRNGAVAGGYNNAIDRLSLVQNCNRYLIYVHSKMMIVDDHWIIVGSANLNERSMAGERDSEVCVGLWASPGQEATVSTQIRNFRKELWNAHLGNAFVAKPNNDFDKPELNATVETVRDAAIHNFAEFIKNGAPNNMGQLMYWDWTIIDTQQLPDSPPGNNKFLWAPAEGGSILGVSKGFR